MENLSNKMFTVSLNSISEPHSILGDVGRGKALAAPLLRAQVKKVGGINSPRSLLSKQQPAE